MPAVIHMGHTLRFMIILGVITNLIRLCNLCVHNAHKLTFKLAIKCWHLKDFYYE